MAKPIFINYRRGLNLAEARLLQKALQRHFGKDGVFLDIQGSLEPDGHWLHTLAAQVEASAAMVSLIPEGWADAKDASGRRRLDDPHDFVRFEIARAYMCGIPVLAAQLNGADMPSHRELPPDIAELSFKQGMLLRMEFFDEDTDKIALKLKELTAPPPGRRVSYWVAGAVAAAALLAGLAGGPSLQAALGINRPADGALRTALDRAEKRASDAEALRKDFSAIHEVALAERDRAQSAMKTAQEALANAQAKGETAASHAAELAAQLKIAEQKLREAETALNAANERAEREEAARRKAEAGLTAAQNQRMADGQEDSARGTTDALKPGESFRDCPDCPEMVVVPAGEFLMGSPESEDGRDGAEGPQHKVTIPEPFAVGRSHVTRGQFAKFVKAAGHKTDGGCFAWTGSEFKEDKNASWRSPGFDQEDDHPVVCVNWNDATAYADWLAKKTGKAYRLLTEAEAEYVARGVTSATAHPRYFFGNSERDLCTYANGADEAAKARYAGWTVAPCKDGYVFTAPAMAFKPNAFGLYGVHGNAWTWTQDCGHRNYHNAPADGSAWTAGHCRRRVLRGGSWDNGPRSLRAACRVRYAPGSRSSTFGFRLARR